LNPSIPAHDDKPEPYSEATVQNGRDNMTGGAYRSKGNGVAMMARTNLEKQIPKGITNQSVVRYRTLNQVANTYGLDSQQTAAIFGVPIRTQARYKKSDAVLNSLVVDRLERFKRIVQQAIDLFEDEAEAQRWLSTPNASLNNQTPLNAMATDGGAKQVEEILYRAEYGVYG
jgi:putative toxin-antitoxin system antitoxin component (TIGR02293 family)